jgi:hypothetical protein
MILFVRSQRPAPSPSPTYHRRLACVLIPAKGDDPSLQPIVARKAVPDFQPSSRNTGGTPMILFVRSERHARPRVQRIIGVSPVS